MTRGRARIHIEGKVNYLAFVEDIIKALGLTPAAAAALTGKDGRKTYTASYLSWWNKNGNAFLANVEDFLDQLGYKLTCEIPYGMNCIKRDTYDLEVIQPTRDEEKADGLANTAPICAVNKVGRKPKKETVLENALKNCKRLLFLAQFIKNTEGDILRFAATMGTDKYRVNTYFENDDISIHFLYDVAEKYGSKLKWTIRPKTEADDDFIPVVKGGKVNQPKRDKAEVKEEAPLTFTGPADGMMQEIL